MIFRVKDYGAVGDGVTDDSPAIQRALGAVRNAEGPACLVFEPGASYRLCDSSGRWAALDLQRFSDLTLHGEDTTLVLDMTGGLKSYVNINECRNMRMEGFHFKTLKPVYTMSDVLAIDREALTMDVRAEQDVGLTEPYIPSIRECFGLPHAEGSRAHMFIDRIEPLDGERCYRVCLRDFDDIRRKLRYLEENRLRFILPVPYWAHVNAGAFIVTSTTNLCLENLDMWSYGHFGFHMRYNDGIIYIRHVNITPEPGTDGVMTGWRDGFHIKETRGIFVWEDCRLEKVHDDMFNLSCTMMTVDAVYSDTEFNMFCPEFGGTYWLRLREGDILTLYDEHTGDWIGRARIRTVVEQKGPVNRVIVDTPLPRNREGVSVGFDTSSQPDSIIRRCYIQGTYRLRTPVLVEDCELATMFAWVDNLQFCEGPIPQDITFRRCKMYKTPAADPKDSFFEPVYMMDISAHTEQWEDARFCCPNIVFEDCELDRRELHLHTSADVRFISGSPGKNCEGGKDQ